MRNSIIIRSFLMLLLSTVLSLSVILTVNAADEIDISQIQSVNIKINGLSYTGEEALLIDGTTYLPFRAFFDYVYDGEVSWDKEAKTAAAASETLTITAKVGDNYICANGRYLYNSKPVLLIEGKVYVPARALASVFSFDVTWDENDGSVALDGSGDALESADTFYDSVSLYWLSRIISCESRGEELQGQIAVGNVVLNRMASDEYPDTVYGVVFDKKFGVQFTPAYNGRIYKEPADISVIAAKICLEGYSISDSIIYFYDPTLSTTSWMEKDCDYEFTIGCHRFFS